MKEYSPAIGLAHQGGEQVPKRFIPTLKMAANAERGLRLRAQFRRGGTEVGVRRANQLRDREELTATDVKSMHSYFARHAVDKNGKAHKWDSDDDPSAGFIAWLLWGGDEGKAWAERHAAWLRATPPSAQRRR